MKKICFNVFEGFKCLAESCSHSCCVGWQIDLDRKTLNLYRKLGKKEGTLTERLNSSIDYTNKNMILRNGRCPFLNDSNLCDIIICEGEKSISQTCKLHPRFINKIGGRIEIGYGLSCQKALSLLLAFENSFEEVLSDGNNNANIVKLKDRTPLFIKKFDRQILAYRKEVLEIVKNRDLPFFERIILLCKKADFKVSEKDLLEYAKFLFSLERLDQSWTNILDMFTQNFTYKFTHHFEENLPQKLSVVLENLLCYFIYRHLPNAVDKTDLNTRLIFAIISTLLVYSVTKGLDDEYTAFTNLSSQSPNSLFEIIRNYSAEIEYSFDNFYKCLDYLESLKIQKLLTEK